MNTIIIILLAIIIIELYFILNNIFRIKDILDKVWHGLFNNPYGGLGKLSYLEYIDTKLETLLKPNNKANKARNQETNTVIDPEEDTLDSIIEVLKEANKEMEELKIKFKEYDNSKSYNVNLENYSKSIKKK